MALVEQQKQQNAQQMKKMRTVVKNVISCAHFARQKEPNCQFSFGAHLQNAADGRWVLILHLYGYCEKKRPAQQVLCWVLFRRWARNFSGYRQVLVPTLAEKICAHLAKSAYQKTIHPGPFCLLVAGPY